MQIESRRLLRALAGHLIAGSGVGAFLAVSLLAADIGNFETNSNGADLSLTVFVFVSLLAFALATTTIGVGFSLIVKDTRRDWPGQSEFVPSFALA
jgi:hypothetical protein